MPFSTLRSRGRARRLSCSLGVAMLPLLLGIPLMYWQSATLLTTRAEKGMLDAQGQLEFMLDSAAQTADAVIGLSGRPCTEVEPQLRHQVMVSPFARSLNLVHDGIIYCTSLMGAYDSAEQPATYSDGRLRLMAGNPVTPERALLVYRQSTANDGVLIGIDGQHLSSLLQVYGQDVPLQLAVGSNWMTADGVVSKSALAHYTDYPSSAPSPRYPFTILASYPSGAALQYMRTHYLPQFLLFLVLGALAGAATYRFSLRSASPSSELQRALAAREFIPYYQPLVNADSGCWEGVEVLMRWQHPSEGLVPPGQFVPLAERLGLIVPMTRALMNQVREDFASRAQELPAGFHIGINITAAHCQNLQLLQECRDFLAAFPAGAINLVLELTERQMITSTAVTERLFAELRELSVRIAIDDFGTGHSSLAYLREFRVDCLKIDRGFVSMIGSDALSRHILDNILDLAVRLQLDLVAEGVETAEQSDYLIQRGIQVLQGYLYARPMPAEALFKTLESPPPHS
ncbi:EAL domain, c-di-GMP-specific phosphodiesterase class I (or its enzymatically inactive variant) [Pseudomonas flavescens]|uniref:cyclic-guanylate-specific phosphodiesterase n=1 Tax=Phytopseudomonas flavescens TaxID=29435 RepID=A0A1G8Q609_9GAMM|nr:EAL domain-containing protein [Pseudomonas flavescens]SDI99956.1 EAL domain, c-di-GMP-specific phosphodiesterase class I (or its enzymatically inactive variant) [Pseudomonas flavescens]